MKKKSLKKCGGANTYRGDVLPRCGCEACTLVWQEAQARRVLVANSPDFLKKHGLTVKDRFK